MKVIEDNCRAGQMRLDRGNVRCGHIDRYSFDLASLPLQAIPEATSLIVI